jgi:hypothetical protein
MKKLPNEQPSLQALLPNGQPAPQVPQQPLDVYETEYPYFLFPYLISENDTISHLKGRVYLDQDVQEAVSSLLSSTVTQARRASAMLFSRDTNDPNADILMEKNIYFKNGSIINGKISEFHLSPPDPGMFQAIQLLVSGNQNETSQVNFAVQNRKDSRKTAKEIEVATQQSQILSTVQVVLFSLALKSMYTKMATVIQSRVLCGIIKVQPSLMPLYQRQWLVKPSGDTDVIEKQQLIQTMMSAWPVIQNTPCSQAFLTDLIEKMFPENAPKYLQAFMQANQQQQSQQAQMSQKIQEMAMSMGAGILHLVKHPEYFSDSGRIHALPALENAADQINSMKQQMNPPTKK